MYYFSIIIPTLNSEKTISKCIDSILHQTFMDYEVLLIDGVSTDSTLSIVHSYNDPRLQVISEPDKGIYDAMNKGIRLSKGEWLYFIGSDDFFYDDQILAEAFEETYNKNLSVLYGNVLINGQIYDGYFDSKKIQTKNICHQAIFYARSLITKLGGYDLKYNVFSDHDLNIKWFFDNKHNHLYINKIIANYAGNGFSTKYHDTFYDELPIKLIRLGIGKLEIKDLKTCAQNAAMIKYHQRKYTHSYYFKFLYFIFRTIDLVQRRIFHYKTT